MIYFPPPFRIPEGTAHWWAVVRWHRSRLQFVRTVPFGYRMILCRLGWHIMIHSFLQDGRVCACGQRHSW